MDRTPVKSGNIKSVGYDPASKVLAVEFNGGKVYHYPGVEPEQHAELIGAESIGGHFARAIRPNIVGQLQKPEDSDTPPEAA